MKRFVIGSWVPMLLVGCATNGDLEETRRQIDLVNQQANVRLSQVETKLANDKLLDLVSRLDMTKAELAKLRGELDVINHTLQVTQKRQNDLYNDLDMRLARFEGRGASEPVAQTKLISSDSQNAEVISSPDYDKALGLLRNRNFAEAVVALTRFIQQNPGVPEVPEVPDATYWLGIAHTAQRQYDAAIDIHRRFVEQYPTHPKAPDALRNIANCQRDLGQLDSAKTTLKRLIKLYPKSSAAVKAKEQLARM